MSGRSAFMPPLFGHMTRLLREPLGAVGLCICTTVALVAMFAPILAPHDPALIDYNAILSPPNWTYPLGTDELGRCVLSRIIYGARISMIILSASIGISMVIGSVIGIVAGYRRGWLDTLLMRCIDALMSLPMLVLALGIIAVLGPNLINAIIAIAIVNIASAEISGCSSAHILWAHFLPNVSSQVIVAATLKASSALITESALSFLGLGVQPPTPSWGSMISVGMDYFSAWWMSLFPGLAIFAVVLGLNFLGDALRDSLDPRLRGSEP